jgi:uncharacterized protein YjiS (DUF1127 family)
MRATARARITRLSDFDLLATNERWLKDIGLTREDLETIARGHSPLRPGVAFGFTLEVAARRHRAKALASLVRQFAAYLRGHFDAAVAAWRRHRELASLLHGDGRAARDLGLSCDEIFAAGVHPWWSWRARTLRDAVVRRRDEAMAAAAARHAATRRNAASPPLVPSFPGVRKEVQPSKL